MKERVSFTFDKETIELLKKQVEKGKFRNLSHAAEDLIKKGAKDE